MSTEEQLQRSAEVLRGMAHPIRLGIVELLNEANGSLSVTKIYTKLDLAQPIVSHHLGVLRNVGVVTKEQQSRFVYYTLSKDVIKSAMDVLAALVEEK
ncbi:MAG: helix-turn-helix transcriptional regulator [Bacteroidia bacterium]|jgi:transcriptional regulator, arsR family|nr:helix-turn-helix transcriptional regulator [Bacteroidia bacterium]MBB1539730.1 helix-turn-helix transcriptional regulator [Bacteroidia bacterium]